MTYTILPGTSTANMAGWNRKLVKRRTLLETLGNVAFCILPFHLVPPLSCLFRHETILLLQEHCAHSAQYGLFAQTGTVLATPNNHAFSVPKC